MSAPAPCALCVVALLVAQASGQTGPFVDAHIWQPGVAVDGSFLRLNTDADIDLEEYPIIPQVLADNSTDVQFFLSPDGSVIYARAFDTALTALCDSTDNQIYFFRPIQDTDTSGHLEAIFNGGLCTNGPVPDHHGLYKDAGGQQYIAYVVEPKDQPASSRQRVHWINLNGLDETGVTELNVDVDGVYFDFTPDGTAALVKHGLVSQPTDADYTLVDLCPSSRLGDPLTSNVGGELFDLGIGNPMAEVIEEPPGSGTLMVRITHPDIGATGVMEVELTPCSGAEPTGACCDGGACSVTTQADCAGDYQGDGTTCPDPACQVLTGACCDGASCTVVAEADCAGTYQGDGTTCPEPACVPEANLSISKTGPATVSEGDVFTYTITYGNAGPDDSHNVEVTEVLLGATLLSASDTPGGTPPVVFGVRITWPIGTLPAGTTNQQVTVTARANCNIPNSQIINSDYSIAGSPGGTVQGAQVVTNLTTALQDPITIAVSSVDLTGPPLQPGELLEHTITLTNTINDPREGIAVKGRNRVYAPGFVSEFDSVVDAAGGTFIVGADNQYFTWEGSIGPSATIDLVFRTRVDACPPTHEDEEILNEGRPMTVRNVCNVEVGSTTPADRFDLVRAIGTGLAALNLGPPQTMFRGGRVQAGRAGSIIEFEMTLVEQYNVDHPNVRAWLDIPSRITPDPPGNPLISPPPGVVYYPSSKTIVFDGPVGAGQTISIRWNGILDPAGACSTDLTFWGELDGCANVEADLTIVKVAVLPTDPYLIGLLPYWYWGWDTFGAVWFVEPGLPASYDTLLCLPADDFNGLGRTPAGELWVAGEEQIIRFNPVVDPPELEIFDYDFQANELGISLPRDVAFDPTTPDPSFVFVGGSAVRRYTPSRPPGQRVEAILDDPGLGGLGRVSIDPEGMIAAFSSTRLVRIDPTGPLPLAPGDYAEFDLDVDSDFGGLPGTRYAATPVNLSVDMDGDYVLTVSTRFFEDFGDPTAWPTRDTYVYSLVKVDRTSGTAGTPTGTVTSIVELLGGTVSWCPTCPPPPPADFSNALLGNTRFKPGLAIGSKCDVFLASAGQGMNNWVAHVVDRSGPVSGSTFSVESEGSDLEAVDDSGGSMMGDSDNDCDVVLDDFAVFADCLAGPDATPSPSPPTTLQECLDTFDFDTDNDVDLIDWGAFQTVFSGSN